MIRINKVYTKTGDKGQTSSACGKRISKAHPAFVLVGKIDFLNSVLGLVSSHATHTYLEFKWVNEPLHLIQNELFQIGALIMTFDKEEYKKRKPIEKTHIERLESQMDKMNENLPELHSFIISGGHPLSAELNLARCITREIEALWWASTEHVHPNEIIPIYFNRLSDFFFVLGRFINDQSGEEEKIWNSKKT